MRRTQALFTLADQLEARLAAARRVLDRLTPAPLHRSAAPVPSDHLARLPRACNTLSELALLASGHRREGLDDGQELLEAEP
jgi:hypothetical protein